MDLGGGCSPRAGLKGLGWILAREETMQGYSAVGCTGCQPIEPVAGRGGCVALNPPPPAFLRCKQGTSTSSHTLEGVDLSSLEQGTPGPNNTEREKRPIG